MLVHAEKMLHSAVGALPNSTRVKDPEAILIDIVAAFEFLRDSVSAFVGGILSRCAYIEEVKVRDGIVIAVATEGDHEIAGKADYTIYIPDAGALVNPILSTIPLQLFAYHVALLLGCDVDKPRNLAKSVTVE